MPSAFAVGFDFDHTLGLDNKLERVTALSELARLAASSGGSYDSSAADAAIDGVLRDARAGDRTIETCIAGFYESFAPAGAHVADAASAFRDAVLANAPKFVTVLPGALELLAKLDALHVPYAMLTNGWSPLQEEKARLIDFRGPVFVSERLGIQKPSRDAFAQLIKHFELPAPAIWYVGDDPSADCAGATDAGLTSVWYDWEERPYPAGLPKPVHTIHTLEELLPLLPCA